MSDWPLLSLTIFLPLVGVAFILFIRGAPEIVAQNARAVALWTALATFLLSLMVWAHFDPAKGGYQLVEQATWLEPLGIRYHVGIDGISLWLVLLSTLLTLVVIVGSWYSVHERVKEYMITFLIMDTLMVGTFCALDIVMFYVFFEGILIPMYLIIGIWGGPRRIYSAFKFFLYTLAGSVLFLVAIIAMASEAGTTSIPEITRHEFPVAMQMWLWLALFASFAVKVPMWPFHTWLPDAHVEAPTGGSVLLAGVLLKLGGYGFLRFSLPMLPEASAFFAPLVFALSIVAIVYTSLVALAQTDMKKLIAYSSVAHMGIVTIGCFTANPLGLTGALVQMLSHGLVSAALFMVVGVVYDRIHSREIAAYGGLAERMPVYATLFMLFMLASVGLPGTSGFVGEILVIVGIFNVTPATPAIPAQGSWVALLAATGMVLGAAYMLWVYRRVIFGALEKPTLAAIRDLRLNEVLAFAPLVLLVILMGVYPSIFTDPMIPSVERVLAEIGASSPIRAAAVAP
ncbi:MAG: NADH-quinone oxidoreductase subunit M [Geminicoccaceae bacterium]|nr:NADH-quinone oxidoreductase subunit M [Geminicoccaceae bacterium]MCS7268442.1 NADH-quinone oxidoreductase subunit M [Geminicoccaceae bacterium]MCX7631308.1 NADH-quinone oxidoreductase subunit M [Geminicoccaceae bacterium]MDW8124906.1 NADH-quinone oxidoreductase subunit M [Geminicoccaceae bacterium]MDW8340954.1 NADH-quinone oxidoreductase subunit M [Geminicoccaceae bacterium]